MGLRVVAFVRLCRIMFSREFLTWTTRGRWLYIYTHIYVYIYIGRRADGGIDVGEVAVLANRLMISGGRDCVSGEPTSRVNPATK